MLVGPSRIRSMPGRKTDVLDCQWLQRLHSYGLLSGAFRPEGEIRRLRSYLKQRDMLVEYTSHHIQKVLTQMNVKLQHVISNITGKTSMRIIKAIVEGERIRGSWPCSATLEPGRTRRPSPGPCWATGGRNTSSNLPRRWSFTGSIRSRSTSATGRSKGSYDALTTAAKARLLLRTAASAVRGTRPVSTFGATCTG